MNHYILNFAQAYGSGTYGASTYACTSQQQSAGTCTAASTATSSGAGSSSGGLANTGIAIAVIVTLACLLIFVALVVRVWRRKQIPVAQEVTVDAEAGSGAGEARP